MGDRPPIAQPPAPGDRILYLLRHAKSSWDDPSLADPDRPLAPRGLKACARLARYAAKEHVSPEVVLCSPARRARETLERLAPALGDPATTIAPSLYSASDDELLRRVRELPEAVSSAMVVGHNPALHNLALLLAGPSGAILRDRFPTGALAALAFTGAWHELAPGAAVLRDFVVPRELS